MRRICAFTRQALQREIDSVRLIAVHEWLLRRWVDASNA
jgi:hypothetical protein